MNGKIVAFPVKNQDGEPKKKRKRGQRKDGRIQRSWQYIRLDNGERDREYFYGHTGAEADRKKEEFKKAYYEQKEEIEQKKKELERLGPMAEYIGITVEDWIPIWRMKYKPKQGISSRKSYDSYIARICRHIGHMKIEDVREMHIIGIYNDLDGYSESMISKITFILNNFFGRAKRNKIIKENPMEDFDWNEVTEGTAGSHRALDKWEQELIFKLVDYHRALTWGAAMALSGMRPGELAAFDCKNALMAERKIVINDSVAYESNQPIKQEKTKTEAGMRIVPMCDMLYRILLPLVEGKKPDDPVFTQANGKRITKSGFDANNETMNNILNRVANGKDPKATPLVKNFEPRPLPENADKYERKYYKARMKRYHARLARLEAEKTNQVNINIRWHDFRHTFATALYDAGIMAKDIKLAQYLLGHKDVRTTMAIYVHLTEDRKKKGAADMVDFLDGWIRDMGINLLEWCQNGVQPSLDTNILYKS